MPHQHRLGRAKAAVVGLVEDKLEDEHREARHDCEQAEEEQERWAVEGLEIAQLREQGCPWHRQADLHAGF